MSNKKRMIERRSAGALDLQSIKIGFVGSGKISEAIITGFVMCGKISPTKIYVSAPSTNNTDRLKQMFPGLTTTKRNLDIFGKFDCDVIFLAVNGNVIRNLYKLGGIRPAPLTTNYIPNMKHPIYILSLITGYEIQQLKDCLLNPEHPEKYQLEMHRIMMSCSCAYGNGICALDVEPDSKKLSDLLRTLLSNISKLEYVPENQMDAACALCGSGLAFSYYFINAMSDGAVKIGLNRQSATKLTSKTVSCASQCLLESGKHPNQLKDEVCAPSGGAIYGISVLDKADVSSSISAAVEAAHKRALALAQQDNPN